jgi:geranylgeranyl diphosphate synthase type II
MSVPLEHYLAERRHLVDAALDRHLPPPGTPPAAIHEAMRYAVLGGGKRIRPIIAMAAAEACGADPEPLVQHFAALELIHTYSLVHDDLPALDNDDLRRGRKTTHVVFGEAMGILTGDALLTEAFSWLVIPIGAIDASRQLRAVAEVAIAVDSRGMIGGQVADLEAERSQQKSDDAFHLMGQLQFIHANKTGRLLTASAVLGGLLAGASDSQVDTLRRYGNATGLAFQIVDDLLDIEETAASLGKTAGKDAAQGKLTYPSLIGADAARQEVRRLLEIAEENAVIIPGPSAPRAGAAANYLGGIARYICERRS